MESSVAANPNYKPRRWYNAHIFPLVPVLIVTKADHQNAAGFTFRWLFLTLWTLNNPSLELSLVLGTFWGAGIVGTLVYLRFRLTIPCPYWLDRFVSRQFNRKPKGQKMSQEEYERICRIIGSKS